MATLICSPFSAPLVHMLPLPPCPLLAVSISLERSSSIAEEGKKAAPFFSSSTYLPERGSRSCQKRPFNGLRIKAFRSRFSDSICRSKSRYALGKSISLRIGDVVASGDMDFNESLSPRILGLCHFWILEWWGTKMQAHEARSGTNKRHPDFVSCALSACLGSNYV